MINCMIFALFIIKGIQYKEFTYKGSEETYTVHGTYKFELWGAQGGGGYDDSDLSSEGGKGAYVYGEASFLSEETLTIKVGGQGNSSEQGPNSGGWPDGGSSGKDEESLFETDYDASGGGGGSTSLYLGNTKLLIAGAGSGGALDMNGCPGGGFGRHYCPQEEDDVTCYELS